MNTTSSLIGEMRDKDYRDAYVASQIRIGIPFQIRALRKSRGWKQDQLAEHAKMEQPRISEIEKPGERRPNIETLLRIAAAFDVGLEVRFLPYSELIDHSESFDPNDFRIKTFVEEIKERELAEQQAKQEQKLVATTAVGIGYGSPYHLDALVAYRNPVSDLDFYNVTELPRTGKLGLPRQTMTLPESVSPASESTHRFSLSMPLAASDPTKNTLSEISAMRKPAIREFPVFDNTEVTAR